MDEFVEDELLIDDEYSPIILADECAELKPIMIDFVTDYYKNQDKPMEEWLSAKLQKELPDCNHEEIMQMTNEIIGTLNIHEDNKKSLSKAIENGRSKESWFASTTQKAVSAMTLQETVKYLDGLDQTLKQCNDSLRFTLKTQAGIVSRNPNLDGFIAEQYHAQTFNMNAKASGSPYRAKVLEPNGKGYTKNSVDLAIVDGNGKIVKKYQSKYCKDAKATEQAFKRGDYRGQSGLVPDGQETQISRNVTNKIEAPDGTCSNPLTKSKAEQMRDEAQNGSWNELNWNEYATKDLATGIAKQAGSAALCSAAISVGFDIAQKVWNDEKIEVEDLVETALVSGADSGIKAAATGALTVGVKKGVLSVIPKGTPVSTLATIAYVGIENAKVMGEMASGELTFKEGVDKLEQTTVSSVAGIGSGIFGSLKGYAIGTAIAGPIGGAVVGFVGGIASSMAGSKAAEKVVEGVQKVRDKVVETVEEKFTGFVDSVCSVGSSVVNFVSSIFGF